MSNDDPKRDDLEPEDNEHEPPRCAACGGTISQEDLVCPHCGVSLAAG